MPELQTILDRIDPASSLDEEDLYNTIVSAQYIGDNDDSLLFDLGDDRRARVARDEFNGDAPFEPGDDIAVLVEEQRGDEWTGSVRKAEKLAIWRWLESVHQSGESVQGMITAENKGGLSVDMGVRAFLPRSHVELHRIDDCKPYLGCHETFEIIQFDKKRGNIVVSRRKILEKEQQKERQELIENLAPGQKHEGIVRNITSYGAFVDIGGIDGLLHVTNMAWGRVDNPSQVVSSGDRIEVVVLDWKPEKKRLGLGRKQLLDDPWEGVEQRYKPEQIVKGTVVSLADFGAFVSLEPGLEGLVHVSELSWTRRINHPGQILKKDQEIDVKILSIDTKKRRIGLSVKQLEENPWVVVAENYPPDTRLTGPIKNITDFGLFVEVEEGVEGLVHVSDISWTESIGDPSEHYEVGQEVEVIVLDIDIDKQRMNLGIKQLDADPWEKAEEVAIPGEKVDVTITKLTEFGAFAELVEGVEGLIHISELSEERVEKPAEVVRPGQSVTALVMKFDPKKRRIGLSLTRDELPAGESQLREYSDDDSSSTTLGDLLGDQLDASDEESD